MAKNSWYAREEDDYIRQRIRRLRVMSLPYGRRTSAYAQIARELYQQFRIRRTWQGVQQRTRVVLGSRRERKEDRCPNPIGE